MADVQEYLQEILEENQKRATERTRAAHNGEAICGNKYNGYTCTRPAHDGDGSHLAHSSTGIVVYSWFREEEP